MNEDIAKFLERNNIDIEKISKLIDCELILPQQANPIASQHGYFYAPIFQTISPLL